jgi:hypothetical protein
MTLPQDSLGVLKIMNIYRRHRFPLFSIEYSPTSPSRSLYTETIDERGAILHPCRGMTRRKNICFDEVVLASRRSSVNWFVRYELTLVAGIHRPGYSEEIFWLLSFSTLHL